MTRKSLIFAVCLATLGAFGVLSSNGIAARDPASISELAPADEYFGHMRLSPFGIRHMIFSLKDDLHHGRRKPDAIEHDALEVQDALQDWSMRYPHDTWIPSALWNLAILYEELPGDDARTHAVAVLEKVHDQYNGTAFATDAQRDLTRGIGVRPWPHWAGSPPASSSPLPASSSPIPSSSPLHSASPLRSALPLPSSAPLHSSSPLRSASPVPPTLPTIDEPSLLIAITETKNMDTSQAMALESKFWSLSHDGSDASYTRCAWQLAVLFESLPGATAQTQAVRLLAFLVDRYPSVVYGRWAMRDLERGVGLRT